LLTKIDNTQTDDETEYVISRCPVQVIESSKPDHTCDATMKLQGR